MSNFNHPWTAPGCAVVTAYAESAVGPGWSNARVWVIWRDAERRLHEACLQPDEQTVARLTAELAAERAERRASVEAEEEICTDDAGQPLICAECHDPMLAGEGGWTAFPDGVRHAYACEGRYYQRELAAEREKRAAVEARVAELEAALREGCHRNAADPAQR